MQEHATDRIYVDDLQNFFVFTGHTANSSLYVSSSTGNRHVVCMSDKNIFVRRNSNGNLLDIFDRSNGSLISQLNLPFASNGCVLIRDELFIHFNGYERIKIDDCQCFRSNDKKIWPIGIYRQGWTYIFVDSAGRTYIPCSNCRATYSCLIDSVCALISERMNNTLLAQVKDYWYISG